MEIKRIISSLKDFSFRKFDKRYTLFLTAFVISVLVKLVLFTIKVNGSVHFSSGIGDSPTLNFLLGYSIYVGVALFFAALGAFSKYFWPAFLLDLILDVWILANLLSLRFHGIMITGYDFRLIGNMNGFWDSLLAFIYFSDILMFLVTGAFIYIYIKLFLWRNRNRFRNRFRIRFRIWNRLWNRLRNRIRIRIRNRRNKNRWNNNKLYNI